MFNVIVFALLGCIVLGVIIMAIWWTREESKKFKIQQAILQSQHDERIRRMQSSIDKQMALGKKSLGKGHALHPAPPRDYIIEEETW